MILPALNEEKHIAGTLTSLKEQYYCDFEIIVVDGGSTDRTVELSRGFGCRVIVSEKKGISHQCNLGAKASDSPILAFTQADTFLPPDWLEKIS